MAIGEKCRVDFNIDRDIRVTTVGLATVIVQRESPGSSEPNENTILELVL